MSSDFPTFMVIAYVKLVFHVDVQSNEGVQGIMGYCGSIEVISAELRLWNGSVPDLTLLPLTLQ